MSDICHIEFILIVYSTDFYEVYSVELCVRSLEIHFRFKYGSCPQNIILKKQNYDFLQVGHNIPYTLWLNFILSTEIRIL